MVTPSIRQSPCCNVMQRLDLASMPNMQGLAGSGEYSHRETAREYARFRTESTIFRPRRDDLPPGWPPPAGLRELTPALASNITPQVLSPCYFAHISPYSVPVNPSLAHQR